MILGRRRADLVIDLPGLTRAQLPQRVEAHRTSSAAGRVWLRLRPDGALQARLPGGKYHSPPLLTARTSALPAGVRLEGEARESALRPFTVLVLSVAALLMGGTAVQQALTGGDKVLFCAGAAALFVGLVVLQSRLRGPELARDLDELQQRVPEALLAGPDVTGS